MTRPTLLMLPTFVIRDSTLLETRHVCVSPIECGQALTQHAPLKVTVTLKMIKVDILCCSGLLDRESVKSRKAS